MYIVPKSKYIILEKYYEEFGDLLPSKDFIYENINIYSYIGELRKKYKRGNIDSEQIIKLENIGMIWDVIAFKWSIYYDEAVRYYENNGNLAIPLRYETENKLKIGKWIQKQRSNYEKMNSNNPNPNFTYDNIKKLNDIEMIWDPYELQWEEKFILAKEYYLKNGNLLIPVDYVSNNNVKLGNWINNQRKYYKLKDSDKKNPKFTEERINKLESIGMIWDVGEHLLIIRKGKEENKKQIQQEKRKKIEDNIWNKYYVEAVKYYEFNKNLLVPNKYTINGIGLGQWIGKQRIKYKEELLSKDEIRLLEEINMIWDVNEYKWEYNFNVAKNYYLQNNNLLIKCDYTTSEGDKLGVWINNQRQLYKLGKLEEDKIKKLESINIIWNPTEEKWESIYLIVEEYFKTNENLIIPKEYKVDDINIYSWISTQKKKYNKGLLEKEKIIRLEKLGIKWNPLEEKWQQYYKEACRYYEKYKDLLIPNSYEINGIKLGGWITLQRKWYKKRNTKSPNKNFTEDKIDLLEKIGMVWDIPKNYNKTSFEEQCVFYYIRKIFPNAKNNSSDLGFEIDILIPEINVGIEYDGEYWHKKSNKMQKDYYKNEECLKSDICLIRIREPKCPQLLDNKSINYKLKNNSNYELQECIKTVVKEQFNRSIDVNIIRDMEDIMEQYYSRIKDNWNEKYELAKIYYREHGNLLIPYEYKVGKINLGAWIGTQRAAYKGIGKSIISKEQINLLEQIEMIWDVKKESWEFKYSLAKKYYKKNGDLLVPASYIVNGIKLGRWIGTQRQAYKGNHYKISDEQINKLNEIGMVWEIK